MEISHTRRIFFVETGQFSSLLCQGSSIRNGLNEHECVANALIQVLAGSDTTATNIRTTMLYLATSPSAYCRLQAEIDQAAASKAISSPVTYAEAKQLPYLQVSQPCQAPRRGKPSRM